MQHYEYTYEIIQESCDTVNNNSVLSLLINLSLGLFIVEQ